MTGPRVEVLTVPPGSLIVLRDVYWTPEDYEWFLEELRQRLGHTEFLVVYLSGTATVSIEPAEMLAKFVPATPTENPEDDRFNHHPADPDGL